MTTEIIKDVSEKNVYVHIHACMYMYVVSNAYVLGLGL
jgi:hypothetical protein